MAILRPFVLAGASSTGMAAVLSIDLQLRHTKNRLRQFGRASLPTIGRYFPCAHFSRSLSLRGGHSGVC
uniref:Putative secreted peptide n=1 Tax=Anopheles braziliensis TaxID=58242 RepID=A0A2M3ZXR2_9DIPT